ncbi:multidrug and toxin extrusion protein 1-like isoform X2 [Hyperolius riggenbachi]|uniref:multidrug and toxin extrusion protein 1-like isoform X2 n=1 Tax=Hyperolius riggenbachi TaxID=752182 RepID=UPI0035A28F04
MSEKGPTCCSGFSRKIKQTFQENGPEFKRLFFLSGPLAITNFLDYAPLVITSMFVGHIGKLQLDAIMLAFAYISVVGVAVGLGLNSACDTLLSQIYGGKNLKYIGVVVQRAFIILSLACFPCWAIYINTENILLLCGQDKDLARETELCVLMLIPALPEIIWPQILVGMLACIVVALFNYLLLFVLNIGIIGAALAVDIGMFFQCLLLFLYIRVRKLHVPSWAGWTTECLEDWGSFMALGVPGILIVSLEFWAYEISMLLTGLINLVELGAQSILVQLITLAYKISFAIGMAASIRVGTFLGAGETYEAKRSAKLSLVMMTLCTLVISIFLIVLRYPLGNIFTDEKPIIELVSQAMPLCALFFLLLSPIAVFNGLLKGIGKLEIGALVIIIGYCLIAFPAGVPLMFPAKLGIRGFWIGMILGFVCIIVFFGLYFGRLDWSLVTEKAQERVGLKKNSSKFEHSIDTPDNKELTDYASLHSSSSETELHKDPPEVSAEERRALKRLIIRRTLEALAAISTLLIGLLIKFTIKHHQ